LISTRWSHADHLVQSARGFRDLSWVTRSCRLTTRTPVAPRSIQCYDPDAPGGLRVCAPLGVGATAVCGGAVNLAYRWFASSASKIGCPDHSVVQPSPPSASARAMPCGGVRVRVAMCIAAGPCGGEAVSVDASLITADVTKEAVPGEPPMNCRRRASCPCGSRTLLLLDAARGDEEMVVGDSCVGVRDGAGIRREGLQEARADAAGDLCLPGRG